MDFLETRIPVKLDRERFLVFNANTMCAFERESGKFFLDVVAVLYDLLKDVKLPGINANVNGDVTKTKQEMTTKGIEILRRVSMQDLRALIWAAVHEYNANDEPIWPLTVNQIGRYLNLNTIPGIFMAFLKGQSDNSPNKRELGESQALPPKTAKAPTSEIAPNNDSADGGERSIALPEGAFI